MEDVPDRNPGSDPPIDSVLEAHTHEGLLDQSAVDMSVGGGILGAETRPLSTMGLTRDGGVDVRGPG